jgi:hypothetical protein
MMANNENRNPLKVFKSLKYSFIYTQKTVDKITIIYKKVK